MRGGRLLCFLGLHAWRGPSDWVREDDDKGRVHVRGVQKCGRSCGVVRDYHKTWTPKVDIAGPTRRIR